MSGEDSRRDPSIERRQHRERRAELLRSNARVAFLAAVLDHLPQPILLLLPGLPPRVWHANAAARRDLAGDAPVTLQGEAMRFADATVERVFVRGSRQAWLRGAGHVEVVHLPSAVAAGNDVHFEALEVGIDAGAPFSRLLLLEFQERISAEEALERLCVEFGLTPTEAEMVLSLHAWGSAVQLARESGKSIHTVRAQLKSAMQKTNTRTQAGLVALVGSRLTG